MAASVKINASIVAILGAIMPDPLAMPLINTDLLFTLTLVPTPFINVSVVQIAFAADFQSEFMFLIIFGNFSVTFLAKNSSPITPVWATKTCFG